MFDYGRRIRQLRVKNGLTLEELASRTELTKGFLSQLERNLTSPSLQTLEDVAEALGVNMSQFFAEEEDEKIVFTQDDVFVDEQDEYTINWIVPNARKNIMEPIIIELKPGNDSKEIAPHEGEEFGYVLSGKIMLVRETGRQEIPVKKGETFYIRGPFSSHLQSFPASGSFEMGQFFTSGGQSIGASVPPMNIQD